MKLKRNPKTIEEYNLHKDQDERFRLVFAKRIWFEANEIPFEYENEIGGSDIKYTTTNTIARYALRNSSYYFTKDAYELSKHLLGEYNSRAKYWQIRNEKGKKLTTNEHPIPCNYLWTLIKNEVKENGSISLERVTEILNMGNHIVVCTQDENKLLVKNGLQSTMPEGWKPGDNPFARYKVCGIELHSELIKVFGGLKR